MTSGVKVSGTWRNLQNLSVNIGGVWHGCVNGYVNISGTWHKFFQGLITDSFSRTTSGSLGTSATGASWTAVRGTWYANGSAAESDDSATNYSIATVNLGSSTNITSASVTPGMGVAFWVQDSNNWWAAVLYESTSTSTYSCTSCYPCSVCATCTYASGTTNVTDCNICGTYTSCASYGPCASGSPCYGTACCTEGTYFVGSQPCTSYIYPCATCSVSTYTTGANCSACGTTSSTCCSTGTCSSTTTNYYLRLISNVGGSISVPTSDVSLSGAPAYIQVSTVGNAITVQAYSDALVTTFGSTLTYTPSSPTLGLNTGIIKTPSANQGATVGNFSSQP